MCLQQRSSRCPNHVPEQGLELGENLVQYAQNPPFLVSYLVDPPIAAG